jgi:hypothetical protein
MGTTQYRNRALAVRGYRLVSVPYWEWYGLQGNGKCQHQYLLQRFIEVGLVHPDQPAHHSSERRRSSLAVLGPGAGRLRV